SRIVDREMIRPTEYPCPQQTRVVGLHEQCGTATVGLGVEGEVLDNGMVDVDAEQTLVRLRLDQPRLVAPGPLQGDRSCSNNHDGSARAGLGRTENVLPCRYVHDAAP